MATAVQYATGKRKNAIARAWLSPGAGEMTVNERPFDQFFPRASLRSLIQFPLEISGQAGKYNIRATVRGGGTTGQAGALRHAISKALVIMTPSLRETIKKEGLLTRDPRVKERKKYGLKGARRRFQYSKR
jgi:small subunit ribosomal protein S9